MVEKCMESQELDALIEEIEALTHDIESYNSDSDEDIYSRIDILEVKRSSLIHKADQILGNGRFISFPSF